MVMARLVFTPRERSIMAGRCTGPHDGAPGLGEVGPGPSYRARCRTCGKLVYVTALGKYAHHKALLPAPDAKEGG